MGIPNLPIPIMVGCVHLCDFKVRVVFAVCDVQPQSTVQSEDDVGDGNDNAVLWYDLDWPGKMRVEEGEVWEWWLCCWRRKSLD